MKTQSIFRIFFLLFTISIMLLEFPGIRDLIESPYSGIETKNLVVQNIDKNGPNASKNIVFGDEIYSIDGEVVRNFNHYRYLVSRNVNYASQEFVFLRGAEESTVEVEYIGIPTRRIERKFKFLAVAFTFLLIGVFVYIRKSDLLGALFSLNCTIIAFFLTDRPIVSLPFLHLFGELFHDAIILVFPAVFLNFFLIFPDRYYHGGTPKELRKMLWIYIAPLVIYSIDCYLVLKHFFYSPALPIVVKGLLGFSTLYMAVYLVASLAIFAKNYRSSPTAQKLRLRIVIAGTIVGIVPFLFTIVLRQISPGTTSNTLDLVSAVSLGFISVSFAYAILKHGAIELNLVIKKSLVYAILTGGIIAVYYTLVNVLGDYFTREFKLSQSVFSILSVLIIAIIFAPARGFFQKVIDRLFYVDDYVYKQEVVEFNRLLSGKLTKKEILECFFQIAEKLLKPSYIAIYLKDYEGGIKLHGTSGSIPSLPGKFPSDSFLARYLSRYNKSLMVEYIDRGWEMKNLDQISKDFLAVSEAAFCLPLVSQDKFFGLIILGSKRSLRLYKRADGELLETFAEHLTLVLENAELHEASIEKVRLKNEVMLARDIQLRLLPESPPKLKSFDILGKMMSSSEIGGDYYDYFSLDDDRIAVVLGDVSGKGIPAAMLVFSIQAVFKNLAIKEKLSPAELNIELNRYLCSNAKPDQFATFFYAILDTRNSTFTFSNAGQHPALLVKEKFVDRLGEGGMLLGVDCEHIYHEGTIKIEAGEMLCMYTDGIVEQKNPQGEEFGTERLIKLLKAEKNLPLFELTESLFASVLAFGEGRQDDDLSCIILSSNTT